MLSSFLLLNSREKAICKCKWPPASLLKQIWTHFCRSEITIWDTVTKECIIRLIRRKGITIEIVVTVPRKTCYRPLVNHLYLFFYKMRHNGNSCYFSRLLIRGTRKLLISRCCKTTNFSLDGWASLSQDQTVSQPTGFLKSH